MWRNSWSEKSQKRQESDTTHAQCNGERCREGKHARQPASGAARSERQEAGGERGAREYGGDAAGVACAGALWH